MDFACKSSKIVLFKDLPQYEEMNNCRFVEDEISQFWQIQETTL